MLPKKFISLLICCSLVIGAFTPLNSLSVSKKSTHQPQSLALQLEDIAGDTVASAKASIQIVDNFTPDSPQAVCSPIVYDQTVDGYIFEGGEGDCYTFTGQLGDMIYAQLDGPDSVAFQLTLSGTGVTTQSCTSYDTCQLFYVTLSDDGVHTLTVTTSSSGYYTLYLGSLNTPPESISYGETVTGTINEADEQDAYQFNGEAGDEIYTYINSPLGAEFYLELFIPGGGSYSCISWETCLIEDVTLPTTGVYTLMVSGSGLYPIDYSLTLGSSGPLSIELGETRDIAVTAAKPLAYQIDIPSGTDDLFITLQKVGIWYWNSKLELSSGEQVLRSAESMMDQILHLPSPAAGTYELEISGSGEGKLSVLASLPDLPLGEWVTGTIYTQFGQAWYQCDVPADQESLHFYVETLGEISQMQVYQNTIGGVPYWSASGATMNLEIPSPDAGRYILQLTDSAYVVGDSQERDHIIKADVVPIDPPACSQPVVTNFTPKQGGTDMPITVSINGQCLDQVSSVCLARLDHDDVCATKVSSADDGRSLTAIFDLSKADPRDWSLMVNASDSQFAIAPQTFEVQSGGETNLWVEITGREQFRIGRTQTYHVSYGNSGPVDAYDVLLNVRVPADVEVSVDLPHPADDSIDWNSVSSVVEVGSEQVIPVWLFRVGAGSQGGFDLSLQITEGQISDQLTIMAELLQVSSKFARTGILENIKQSPVFLALVESIMENLESNQTTSQSTQFFSSGIRSPMVSFDDVVDGLYESAKSFWDNFGPEYAIIGAGVGLLLGFALGGPLIGLLVGISLGSAVDAVMSAFQLHKLITIPVFRKLAELFGVDLIDSISPEDKFGPSGYDPSGSQTAQKKRWIPADRAMDYRIDFWNKEDAPAATVDVIITDTLDTDLDWGSFYFTEIGFLDWQVPLEPTQYFNVDVADVAIDLSIYYPGEPVVEMLVNVEGTYDASTGYIEWHFHTLDPITRQPPENPYAGFLPPITDSGWEIGWVEFSVAQDAGLSSGIIIQNQAFVKFDQNKFNPAPKGGPFINTIDSEPPVSAAQISNGGHQCSGVLVTWTAQDDQSGSGIESVDLYADDLNDTNPPYLYLGSVQEGWAMFNGVPGGNYGFYTRARDNVGNLEPAPNPLSYDAQVTVDSYCLFAPMGLLNSK